MKPLLARPRASILRASIDWDNSLCVMPLSVSALKSLFVLIEHLQFRAALRRPSAILIGEVVTFLNDFFLAFAPAELHVCVVGTHPLRFLR